MNYRTVPLLAKKAALEEQRTARYGPAPINIFKQLRLDHGFTHDELRNRIYISKQALIRLEQGTYDNPLPTVLEWWANHTCESKNCPANKSSLRPGEPIGELYLRDAYADFQTLQRLRFTKCFGVSLRFSDAESSRCYDDRYHPFRILRDRALMSATEVAKSLCIPQATVEHFEKKFKTQQTVPRNLRYALREIKYPSDEIAEFCRIYEDFRKGNRRELIKDEVLTEQLGVNTYIDDRLPPGTAYLFDSGAVG